MANAIALVVAGETRNPDGTRRWGSTETLRRKIKSKSLPAEMVGGKYFVERADLDDLLAQTTYERAYAELKAAARRAAKLAPPISAERCDGILAILRGAS